LHKNYHQDNKQKDDYERRKKQVAEALFADIKQLKLLEIQRKQLKESIYEAAVATQEHSNATNNTFLPFVVDDYLFIVKKGNLKFQKERKKEKEKKNHFLFFIIVCFTFNF